MHFFVAGSATPLRARAGSGYCIGIRRLFSHSVALRWLCFWLASTLHVQSARGSDGRQPVQLRVVAPRESDCSSAAMLEARVAQRLADSLTPSSVPALEVEFARAPEGGGWTARVRAALPAGFGAGERQIASDSQQCASLDDALVIVLATFVGVANPALSQEVPAADEARAPPEPPAPHADAQPASPPEAERASAHNSGGQRGSSRVRAARLAWDVGANVVGAMGQLPGFAWGASLNATGQRRMFSLVLGAEGFLGSIQALGGGAEARFAALLARVDLCAAALEGRGVRFGPCAGMRVGALLSQTRGLARSAATWVPAVDAELGARLSGPLSSGVGWSLALAAILPIKRSRFAIEESGGEPRVYHRVQPGFLLELGVIFRLRS